MICIKIGDAQRDPHSILSIPFSHEFNGNFRGECKIWETKSVRIENQLKITTMEVIEGRNKLSFVGVRDPND